MVTERPLLARDKISSLYLFFNGPKWTKNGYVQWLKKMCGVRGKAEQNDVILFCKLGKFDAEMRVVAVQKQEALLICVLRLRVRFKTAL